MSARVLGLLILGTLLVASGCAGNMPVMVVLAPAESTGQATQNDLVALDEAIDLVAQLRYEEAAPRLLTLSVQFEAAGDRDRTAEATFWLGYCYEKQGRYAEAGDLYARVVQEYPSSPAASQAARRFQDLTPQVRSITAPQDLPK